MEDDIEEVISEQSPNEWLEIKLVEGIREYIQGRQNSTYKAPDIRELGAFGKSEFNMAEDRSAREEGPGEKIKEYIMG